MQPPIVLFKIIGHVLCIIDMSVGQYAMFNVSGSQVWLDLMQDKETNVIVEELYQQYPDTSFDVIQSSIEDFVTEVSQKQLLALPVQSEELEALRQEILAELGDFVPSEFIPPRFEDSNSKELLASGVSIVI